MSVDQRRTACLRAATFLTVVVRQADVTHKLADSLAEEIKHCGTVKIGQYMAANYTETYILVLALSQACRWLKVVAKHDPLIKNAVRAFTASLPHVHELRDMWEHEIEYFEGRGRRSDRWSQRDPVLGIGVDAIGIALWDGPSGRHHRIGGRLDVIATVAAAKKLLSQLNAAATRIPRAPRPDAAAATSSEASHGSSGSPS